MCVVGSCLTWYPLWNCWNTQVSPKTSPSCRSLITKRLCSLFLSLTAFPPGFPTTPECDLAPTPPAL